MGYMKFVAAAILARTNYGMPRPTAEDMRGWCFNERTTLGSAVLAVCQQFIENDDHYEMFMDEARGWLDAVETLPTGVPDWVNELLAEVV